MVGVFSDLSNLNMNSDAHNNTSNNNSNQNTGSMHFSTHPIDLISPSLSEDEIKSQVDQIIKKWEMGINERKSLLYLLSTVDEVWGANSNLGNIALQDLLENKALVRTYYKKVMRELHPDKNKDKSFKVRYIASSLYQIFNEANSVYPS